MPKPTPDLRTSNVQLDVQKWTNLQGIQEQAQKHWGLRRIQPYFPSIQKLFKLENVRMPYHYGLKLQCPIQTISSEGAVYVGGKEVPAHLKKTMLNSPYRVMHGEFAGTGLPNTDDVSSEPLRIQNPYNAGYVG